MRTKNWKAILSKGLQIFISLLMVFNVVLPATSANAAETLSITPITWNIIGLDSNNPPAGPNRFPVGVRICNEGTTDALNVSSNFVWDSYDEYINLTPGSITSFTGALATPTLAPGACVDQYYEVTVTQTKSAYNHTRKYHVTASSDNFADVSTSANRELYVEHLVSQNRNSTTSLWIGDSPSTLTEVTLGGAIDLVVGKDYYLKLNAQTAPGGYNELESFVTLPNTVFDIHGVAATYVQQDAGIDTSLLYADSCGWDNDTTSATYRSCIVDDGKTGGVLSLLYHLTVLSTSSVSASMNTLIYDFSGSSFHYNSDFNSPTIRFNFVNQAGFTKSFDPAAIISGDVSTLTFSIENLGTDPLTNVSFSDDLPAGINFASPDNLALDPGCSGSSVASILGTTFSVSALEVAAGATCNISMDVTSSTAEKYTNVTSNLFINGSDSGLTASADLIVSDQVVGAGCTPADLAVYNFQTVANSGSLTNPTPVSYSFPSQPTANLGAGLKSYTSDPSHDHTGTPTGTSAWGYQGTNSGFTQKGALDLTQNTYYEFIADTSGLESLSLDFYFAALLQGPTVWTLYAYPDGELATDNTSLSTGTIVPISGATTWTAGSYTFDLTKVTPDVNLSGNTVFRLYVSNAGADNAGVGDGFLDDVVFSGCGTLQPTLAKVFDPAIVSSGENSVLTFTLTNPNGYDLTGASFTDILPSGVTASSAQTTCTSGDVSASTADTISLSGGVIPASGSCTVTVDTSITDPGVFNNLSGPLVTAEIGTSTTAPATSSLTLGVSPEFSKQFIPATFYAGGNTILSFTISNPNPTDLTGAAFTDALPSGLLVNADTPSNTCGGTLTADVDTDTISLSGGTIPASDSCTIEVGITAATEGLYSNLTGDLTTDQNTDPVTAAADVAVIVITPAISLLKQVSTSSTGPWTSFVTVDPNLATDVYYRFVVENIGDADLTDVILSDPDIDLSGCALSAAFALPVSDPIAACVVGPIAPVEGYITNQADVSGVYGEQTVTDTSTASYLGYTPVVGPSILISKQISAAPSGPWTDQLLGINVGSEVYYRFVITTNGDVPLTITALSDDLLAGVDMTSCVIATTLSAGASTACTYGPVTTEEGISINTASVDYTDGETPNTSGSNPAVYTAGTGSVGGTVWLDTNTDTVIDAGESGITGAVVDLYYDVNNDGLVDSGDILLSSTLTDLNGGYLFSSVPLSGATVYDYLVVETDPSGVTFTGSNKTVSTSGSQQLIQLQAFGADSLDNNYGYNTTVATAPDLVIGKDNNTDGIGAIGTAFTWIITGSNIGDGNATFNDGDVILSDDLASNASYGTPSIFTTGTSGTGSISCAIASSVLTCSASGGTVEVPPSTSFRVELVTTPASGVSISNTAVIDPDGTVPESDEENNSSGGSTVTFVVEVPDLTIQKTNDLNGADASIGSSFHWILTVSNSANTAADFAQDTVIVSDNLPAGLSYGSVSITSVSNVTNTGNLSCGINGSLFTCIAVGGSVSLGTNGNFTVSIQATPAVSGALTNTAQVDPNAVVTESDETNNTANNTVNIAGQVYDLSITKTDSLSIARNGQTVRYTIKVRNVGTETITGAKVTDPAVSGLTKTAAACSSTPGICATAPTIADLEGTGVVLPSMAAGEKYEFTVDALVTATSGTVINTAHVSMPSGITDSKPNNNSGSDTDNVAFFGLALNKFVANNTYNAAGDVITYHYTLTNQSNAPLYAPFTVNDDKFADDLICTAKDNILSVGEVLICEQNYTITADDVTAGSVTNTAVASGYNAASGGSMVISNTDMVTISYQQPAPPQEAGSAAFTKQISGDSLNWYDSIAIASGSNVYYRLSLENTGSVALTNVAIYDNMSDCELAGPVGDIDSDNQLDTNETWAYTCSLIAQDGPHTNVATASAAQLPQPLSDNAVYTGLFTAVFDPPTSTKYLTASGTAEVETRMVWINSGNTTAINVQVTDVIPAGTVYVPGSLTCAPFGSSFTAGSASAPLSFSATPSSACGYDSATNRIQWQGNIAPNFGVTSEQLATNKVIISFRVSLLPQTNSITNTANGLVDSDNDGSFTDEDTIPASSSASNAAVFNRYQDHVLPVTGFNPNIVTTLPKQPNNAQYGDMGMILEIPSLGVVAPLMAVPQSDKTWDVTWLGDSIIGWLEGTAFPTHAGNSILTGHVLDEANNPGPFNRLKDLKEGDRFSINAWGTVYEYEVRSSKLHFSGTEVEKVFKEKEGTWVTLVTCEFWNPLSKDFMFRRTISAELVGTK